MYWYILNIPAIFLPVLASARAFMHFPKLLRDWLINVPSTSLSPVAPIAPVFSLEVIKSKT